ncbi:MAG: transposase family protein [Deltaproteobacteria bacterium]|nr:transposase family protein [Deltaproteobacteria bacterium]
MSTSLLYHVFGIRGYKYVRTHYHYENGSVLFTVRQNTKEMRYAACGSRRVIRRGQVWRRFRSVPTGLKPVWILPAIQRVYRLDLDTGAVVFLGEGKGAEALDL